MYMNKGHAIWMVGIVGEGCCGGLLVACIYVCVCMYVRVVRVVVFVGWVWWSFVGVVGLYIHVNQNVSYGWI